MTDAPRPRLRRATVVLLAPVPLLVLLALLEGALWLAGLGDPHERLSTTRGFSDEARYLLPDPRHPGGYITQIWDGQDPEQELPPKGERLRVLLFGGSNTMRFATEVIEQKLNAAAPEPGFEVINLGREGYGSERVLILMRQAMVLQPDLVFIYVGHNEFVERGFALELIQLWRQPWISRAVDGLSRLRTLNLAVELLASTPRAASGSPPERRLIERGPEFEALRYEETLVVYDCYRRNLEAMLRVAGEHGAGVMLCTVVGNMLYAPMVPGLPDELPPERQAELAAELDRACKTIPGFLRYGLIESRDEPAVRLNAGSWGEVRTEDGLDRRRAAAAQLGIQPVTTRLRTLGPPFDDGPYWSDSIHWNQWPSHLLPALVALHERQLTPERRARIEAAAAQLEALRQELPEHAGLLHALGVCTYILGGRDEQAVALLRDAARFDRAPTRGNDISNGIVRELARAHPEVVLVDAEEHVRAACPSGLIGYELMMDNCHLHPAARLRLLDAFIPGLLELGRRQLAD